MNCAVMLSNDKHSGSSQGSGLHMVQTVPQGEGLRKTLPARMQTVAPVSYHRESDLSVHEGDLE